MSDSQRKLLPYEHQLIEALDISKEEYLAFVAQQHIYEDPKAGTVLDARNWEAVSIVLTIVGILFQVVAVLLAPKPAPLAAGGEQATTREDIFSPRYGFNSAPALARYGDPVNLVYANSALNPIGGGVRVTTPVLWSSIQSYGASQLVQLVLLISGGSIGAIDFQRTAWGQTPLGNLIGQNYWLYFAPRQSGILRNADVRYSGFAIADPTQSAKQTDAAFGIRGFGTSAKNLGFSHAYTPASSQQFGVYGIVPINVEIYVRDSAGDLRGRTNGVRLTLGPLWGFRSNPSGGGFEVIGQGTPVVLEILSPLFLTGGGADPAVREHRRVMASIINNASTFKVGSLLIRLVNVSSSDFENGQSMLINGVVIKSGRAPSLAHNITVETVDRFGRAFARQPYGFSLKALATYEEASYETVSPCNQIDFSIKARVFRRISGRQLEYGSERRLGYDINDNGIKFRQAFFLVKYKQAGSTQDYRYIPRIFVVRRAAEVEDYVFLRFFTNLFGASHWQFKFEPVIDPYVEVIGGFLGNAPFRYCYLDSKGKLYVEAMPDGTVIEWAGMAIDSAGLPPINDSPGGTSEYDLFSNTSDTPYQFSFDQGPEFTLAAVTEQIYGDTSGLYKNLSLMGVTMLAGKTVQDLRNLSTTVTFGRLTRALVTQGAGWGSDNFNYLTSGINSFACRAPDIFVDTILDKTDGIGNYASLYSTDLQQLAISKKFCETNNLFMEGVIAEAVPWREFWAANAGLSLLELARIGGQDVLVPAVPYDRTTGALSSSIAISALFNQGNILEDSYKEEFIDYGSNSQDVIVRVIFRKLDSGGVFAVNDSVTISLVDTVENYATQETIDASAYVSRKDQAILIGKLLCLSKRHSKRAIEFKTFPTDSPVFPGAYVYIELAHNSWDRIYSGIVEEGGFLNTPSSIANNLYTALTYRHGANTSLDSPTGTKYYSSVAVETLGDGRAVATALAGDKGNLFVLGHAIRRKRVFRVTEVNMDEEGEVTIRGVEHATDVNGFSQIGLGMLSNSIWHIQ